MMQYWKAKIDRSKADGNLMKSAEANVTNGKSL